MSAMPVVTSMETTTQLIPWMCCSKQEIVFKIDIFCVIKNLQFLKNYRWLWWLVGLHEFESHLLQHLTAHLQTLSNWSSPQRFYNFLEQLWNGWKLARNVRLVTHHDYWWNFGCYRENWKSEKPFTSNFSASFRLFGVSLFTCLRCNDNIENYINLLKFANSE